MPPQACPFCKTENPKPVRFTAWGGFIGPAVLSLVECAHCGGHFNGKSGRCVKKAIRVYTLGMLLALIMLAALTMYQLAGTKKNSSNPSTGASAALTLISTQLHA